MNIGVRHDFLAQHPEIATKIKDILNKFPISNDEWRIPPQYIEDYVKPHISIDVCRENPTWRIVSIMSGIATWEEIMNNPDIQWDWAEVSANPNITWDIIKSNLHFPWEVNALARNPNITLDMYNNSTMARNPNVCKSWDWELIDRGIVEYGWTWWYISQNPNLTWEIVWNNRERPWNFMALSMNNFYH